MPDNETENQSHDLSHFGIHPGDEHHDITVHFERDRLDELYPGSSLEDSGSPLDIGQIRDHHIRDMVLVAGNVFALLNASAVLAYCLWEAHYFTAHYLGKFEPTWWQLGLIFGPLIGYNCLAWFLRIARTQ